jgi:excisionase family DNA binding protein
MKTAMYPESAHTANNAAVAIDAALANSGLPTRLMTAFEVAEFVGCHEETVRRAYLRGLLISQRLGVRSRRFHPRDVLDWIRRGAPTRPSRSIHVRESPLKEESHAHLETM